jgi:cytochrome c oxidase subunit I+III
MATVADTRLTRVWEGPAGLARVLGTVDHKVIGVRYIITAFILFLLAGVEILFVRMQLAQPENGVLSPEAYNQFFTMHGTTMIFLLRHADPVRLRQHPGAADDGRARHGVPALERVRLLGVPVLGPAHVLQLPVRHGAGRRLVRLRAADRAAVLAGAEPGLLGAPPFFLSISSTAGALNFIVSILKMRAPGMSINRMPLFIWAILITSLAVIFAVPALTTANILLVLERKFAFHFFDGANGRADADRAVGARLHRRQVAQHAGQPDPVDQGPARGDAGNGYAEPGGQRCFGAGYCGVFVYGALSRIMHVRRARVVSISCEE